MVRLLPAALLVAAAALPAPAGADDKAPASPGEFFFRPGDRVVFLGDSITEQYQYSTYVELYLTTRFPNGKMSFLNAGIGGDTAGGGAGRFQSHVLDEKPTAVTINFGMNDGGYGKFDANRAKQFAERTEAMLKMAKDAGVRVALLSPNAVDKRNKSNGAEYVVTQKQFYAPLAGLAGKYGFAFVDQYAITKAATDRMEEVDPKAKSAVPYYDGFHTSPPGGLLMAHAILTGLKAPAAASEVELTAAGGIAAKGAMVTELKAGKDGVTFTRLDDALPLPVQKDWLPMLPYTNELRDLNRYGLTVKGLAEGNYAVKIDGKEVAKYTAKQLADGVNLGTVTTGPVWEQGNAVLKAINDKNRIVHGRFRGILLNGDPYWSTPAGQKRRAAELATRRAEADAAQAEVYKLAAPQARRWEVRPAQ
ncbi:GDSL-type esterase/lipase family protein [Urbifossiella limnaea]|uniref:GDSL-like Lipase/Acylhydrolase n=1 Tax=Urbifossiella limnaea TaxID=2528023 RepID=A0A517Y110_9BACT|nr:GDSL-type esterase/lipase family protein [Urbifossiella limnaea]QDU23408.1 GDSL-like Lipase/Acylhydrolase [Urbifossiella limnaea]